MSGVEYDHLPLWPYLAIAGMVLSAVLLARLLGRLK